MRLRRSRHRRRPPTEWGPYEPMPSRFIENLTVYSSLSTEEAQSWFDELLASKDHRIGQVRALLERNGVNTSDPAAAGFWRTVTQWLDEHAEYDAEQAKRTGRYDVGAGFPLVWKSVAADIDLWLVDELVRRGEGAFEWWLPLEDREDMFFQKPTYRHGFHGVPQNVLGRAINFAYSDYVEPRRPSFPADLEVWLENTLAEPMPTESWSWDDLDPEEGEDEYSKFDDDLER